MRVEKLPSGVVKEYVLNSSNFKFHFNWKSFGQLLDSTTSAQEWQGFSSSITWMCLLLAHGLKAGVSHHTTCLFCDTGYGILNCAWVPWPNVFALWHSGCCLQPSCTGALWWWFNCKSLFTMAFVSNNIFFGSIFCLTSDCSKAA